MTPSTLLKVFLTTDQCCGQAVLSPSPTLHLSPFLFPHSPSQGGWSRGSPLYLCLGGEADSQGADNALSSPTSLLQPHLAGKILLSHVVPLMAGHSRIFPSLSSASLKHCRHLGPVRSFPWLSVMGRIHQYDLFSHCYLTFFILNSIFYPYWYL